MPEISKINALGIGSVLKLDGLAKASILNIDGVPLGGAAYSVRLLDSLLGTTYTGAAMRVRRDTGGGTGHDDEADLAFDTSLTDPAISLDSAISNASAGVTATTLGQFLNVGTVGGTTYTNPDTLSGTASCYVVSWKDQSGNGNDADQPTAGGSGLQPQIHSGTVNTDLITENGKPALNFAADYLAADWDITTEVSCVVVCADVGFFDAITGNQNLNFGFWIQNRFNSQFWLTGLDSTYSVAVDPTSQQVLISGAFDSNNQQMYANSSSTITADSRPFDGSGYRFRIGYVDSSPSGILTGKIQEVIFWNRYRPTDITSIHTSVNNYFQVY